MDSVRRDHEPYASQTKGTLLLDKRSPCENYKAQDSLRQDSTCFPVCSVLNIFGPGAYHKFMWQHGHQSMCASTPVKILLGQRFTPSAMNLAPASRLQQTAGIPGNTSGATLAQLLSTNQHY